MKSYNNFLYRAWVKRHDQNSDWTISSETINNVPYDWYESSVIEKGAITIYVHKEGNERTYIDVGLKYWTNYINESLLASKAEDSLFKLIFGVSSEPHHWSELTPEMLHVVKELSKIDGDDSESILSAVAWWRRHKDDKELFYSV